MERRDRGHPETHPLAQVFLFPPFRTGAARLVLGIRAVAFCLVFAFLFPRSLEWPHVGSLVVLEMALLAAIGLYHTAVLFSAANAAMLFGWSFLVSWLAEAGGVQRGWFFGGRYSYAEFLGPQLPGNVPVAVPLAWFCLCCFAVLPSRHLVAGRGWGTLKTALLRAAAASYTICVVDLLLDPLSTRLGAWSWGLRGAYYDTPWGNYPGWLGVGMAIFSGYFLCERSWPSRASLAGSRAYAWRAWLEGVALLALPMVLAFALDRGPAALLCILFLAPVLILWSRTGAIEAEEAVGFPRPAEENA